MDKKTIYKQLGINIKTCRNKIGFTQAELADRAGVSVQFIGKIETGFSKPSFNTIIDISYALNIQLEDLFSFNCSKLET